MKPRILLPLALVVLSVAAAAAIQIFAFGRAAGAIAEYVFQQLVGVLCMAFAFWLVNRLAAARDPLDVGDIGAPDAGDTHQHVEEMGYEAATPGVGVSVAAAAPEPSPWALPTLLPARRLDETDDEFRARLSAYYPVN